jgi:hypothetical protein
MYGMIKILKIDRANRIAVIEISRDELERLVDSVNIMADKQQRDLLENPPSNEYDRRKLDNSKALKEDLRKVLDSLF